MREYVSGDDLRRIHWPSVARTNRLMIRQDESTRRVDRRAVPRQPRQTTLGNTGSPGFERAISAAATVGRAMIRAGFALRLATGRTPRPGVVSEERLLETLAASSPVRKRTTAEALTTLRRTATTDATLAVVCAPPFGGELADAHPAGGRVRTPDRRARVPRPPVVPHHPGRRRSSRAGPRRPGPRCSGRDGTSTCCNPTESWQRHGDPRGSRSVVSRRPRRPPDRSRPPGRDGHGGLRPCVRGERHDVEAARRGARCACPGRGARAAPRAAGRRGEHRGAGARGRLAGVSEDALVQPPLPRHVARVTAVAGPGGPNGRGAHRPVPDARPPAPRRARRGVVLVVRRPRPGRPGPKPVSWRSSRRSPSWRSPGSSCGTTPGRST